MTRIDSILRCGTGFFGFTMDGLKSSAVQNTPGKSQIPARIARTVCFSCRAESSGAGRYLVCVWPIEARPSAGDHPHENINHGSFLESRF